MFSIGGIKGLAAFATFFLEGVTIKRGSLKVGNDRRLFLSGNFNARPTLSPHMLKQNLVHSSTLGGFRLIVYKSR